jgi:myo-inositol catabolism protein IolS
MKYRRLGQTDIMVSAVCMGGWSISTRDFFWDGQIRDDSIQAIQAALETGINFFDTAPSYGDGDSEEVFGEALGAHRQQVVLATKIGLQDLDPASIHRCCETSLRRLKTDYIDLYQVHWPNAELPLEPTYEALLRLKAAGKVRAVGVSNFGVTYLSELMEIGRVESNQLPYSLLWRAVEHEIAPTCLANGIGILCYSPLCQGLLTGKFATADDVPEKRARTRLFSSNRPLSRHGESGCETDAFAALVEIRKIAAEIGQPMSSVAMAWLLHQESVTSVVAGARNAKQVVANACAADLKLDNDIIRRLASVTEEVKRLVGRNADTWDHVSRMERLDRRHPPGAENSPKHRVQRELAGDTTLPTSSAKGFGKP